MTLKNMAVQDFSVLIADDNELNRWLLCEQLRLWTTEITSAAEGREAWRLLEAVKYTLIFIDLNMPFLNGLDLIAKIRTGDNINRWTPVIAVTAHSYDSLQRETLIAAGFNDCLFKPILLQNIQQIIEQWLFPSMDNPGYYAAQIVKKIGLDGELSQQLLNKLFLEVPEYLLNIAQAVQKFDYKQAWQAAHKLHGTFCFYGFNDFLPMAEILEESLLKNDTAAAKLHLWAIQIRFSELSENKAAILAKVAGEIEGI